MQLYCVEKTREKKIKVFKDSQTKQIVQSNGGGGPKRSSCIFMVFGLGMPHPIPPNLVMAQSLKVFVC